jgi:hypothetical protein
VAGFYAAGPHGDEPAAARGFVVGAGPGAAVFGKKKKGKREGSSSFLKKEPKNFYLLAAGHARRRGPNEQKFFVSFFQKRNTSLLSYSL